MAQIAERIMELRPAGRPEDGMTWNRGWYDGITAAATVARQIASEPDPLRELAEWLANNAAGLATDTTAAAVLYEAITRARAALGKED